MTCDVLVVGAGAAGMAAALSARQAGAEAVLLVDRDTRLGGVLPQCLHTGFGEVIFRQELTGAQYAARWAARVEASCVTLRLDTTVLSLSPERRALLSSPEGVEEVAFRALVLAAGCREIPIGALALPGSRPAGIFTAGQAQRMMNLDGLTLGRSAVILGSGDVGLVMTRQLALSGCQVLAWWSSGRDAPPCPATSAGALRPATSPCSPAPRCAVSTGPGGSGASPSGSWTPERSAFCPATP